MPSAAARFEDDFDDEVPAPKKAPRRSAKASASKPFSGKRKKGKSRFRFDLDMQRVARFGAIGMSATVAVGIIVNALMMQKGHHPAPLFGKSIELGQSAVKAAAPAVAAATKKDEPAPAPLVRSAHAAPPASKGADAEPSSSDDAIGRLLQGGPVSTDRPNAKTVVGVQRALTKLGFSVKQTGTFGPQTRKAIEHFEKDHHLPIKGEMSRRVVKLIASASGVKIEN